MRTRLLLLTLFRINLGKIQVCTEGWELTFLGTLKKLLVHFERLIIMPHHTVSGA